MRAGLETECRSLVGDSTAFTELSLCSGSAHTASCTAHVFDQVFFFYPFFDPLCTSIYSLKGKKGCVVIIIVLSGRSCKEILIICSCYFSLGCNLCVSFMFGTKM